MMNSQMYIILVVIIARFSSAHCYCSSVNDCQITPGQAFACLSSGNCLCNPGWTGPNATYLNIDTPVHGMRLVASNCKRPCNTVSQPSSCASEHSPQGYCSNSSPEDQLRKDGLLPPAPATKCHPRCTMYGAGKCSTSVPGACECHYGWTGPNSCFYDQLGSNKILALYCTIPCHYNHNVRNSRCVGIIA